MWLYIMRPLIALYFGSVLYDNFKWFGWMWPFFSSSHIDIIVDIVLLEHILFVLQYAKSLRVWVVFHSFRVHSAKIMVATQLKCFLFSFCNFSLASAISHSHKFHYYVHVCDLQNVLFDISSRLYRIDWRRNVFGSDPEPTPRLSHLNSGMRMKWQVRSNIQRYEFMCRAWLDLPDKNWNDLKTHKSNHFLTDANLHFWLLIL